MGRLSKLSPSKISVRGSVSRPVRRAAPRPSRYDTVFDPSDSPSLEGSRVEQVIVTSETLREDFEAFAVEETRKGIPTVVTTVTSIRGQYPGMDTPAKIRAFLRDAHDLWGTRFVLLGGDTEHVPTRYIPWSDKTIASDYYYQCLDGEWNEDGDAILAEPLLLGSVPNYVSDVAAAPDGKIWLGTGVGAAYLEAGRFVSFDTFTGLPSVEILTVEIGADASVWVGTKSGVARWDGTRWSSYGIDDGLPGSWVTAVLALAQDEVWVGTSGGLARFDGSHWKSWGVPDGLPAPFINDLAHDGENLWIATYQGVAKMSEEHFDVFSTSNSAILSNWILAVAVDDSGRVVLGHEENALDVGGLSWSEGATWIADAVPEFAGLSFRSLRLGPAEGEVWAATSGGLFHRSDAGDELIGAADGLSEDLQGIAMTPSGEFAVGGTGGLSVGNARAWTVYTSEHGLPSPETVFDDIDLVPDLALGRLPVTDEEELAVYLKKLELYRNGKRSDRADEVLFLGERLFNELDGKKYCRLVQDAFPESFGRTELYESDANQNAALCLAGLAQGPGMVVQVGHGSYDAIGSGPQLELLFNSHLRQVDSGGRFCFYVVYSCNSGGFDQECSMENAMFNPDGGAIATMANTRTAVPNVDSDYNIAFFENLFASAHARPAVSLMETFAERVEQDPARVSTNDWPRRMLMTRSYLGPPTLALWRGVPQALTVTHPAKAPLARASFLVTVKNAETDAPIPGARVTVSKGTEDYVSDTTDLTGQVSFSFRPERPGDISVYVSHPGYIPYDGRAEVSDPDGPNLVGAGHRISSVASDANGTWLTLALGIRNRGTSSMQGWTVDASSPNPGVRIQHARQKIPALDAGETAWVGDFVVKVNSAFFDDESLALVLEGTGASSFVEEYVLPASRHVLQFDGLKVDGSTIYPRVTNRGDLESGPLRGTLVLVSGNGSVIDGNGACESVSAGETVTFSDGFRVSGDPRAVYRLSVTDPSRLTVFTCSIDLDPPPGVVAVRSEPTVRGALLQWTPSNAPDLAGYRVLSEDGAGGWIPEFDELVRDGSRVEVSMPPNSSREFRVIVVDESGHESPDSAFVRAYSSPGTIPGWPQRLSAMVGPAPIVAADIDGDQAREILVGSMWEADALHVFRADGSEWTDGDGDPATNGIFGETAERIHGAPLILDVDGDGSAEIFVGSYDGFVYAWRTNGPAASSPSTLPGWPLPIQPPGVRVALVNADLDGDGDYELLVPGTNGHVYAFEVDGSPVPGWPKITRESGFGSVPAVADLNEDGLEDVVFCATDSLIYAVSGDGTDLPGWPLHTGSKLQSCPVLADVDDDGDLEIFAIGRDGSVWGVQHDDSDAVPGADVLPGWPVQLAPNAGAPPSPAVADFDRDGTPEIVVNGMGEIAVLRSDGSDYPGWPVKTDLQGVNSPVVADLDGDGSYDILVGSSDFRLTAYRSNGTVLPGWPIRLVELPASTPYVADIDSDGDLDVAIGANDGMLQVLDVPGPALPAAAPWPGHHGAYDSRGVYNPKPLNTGFGSGGAPTLEAFAAFPPAPNPFDSETTFRFSLPQGAPVWVEIFDVSGRRVATPARGRLFPAGRHRLVWDGRDQRGKAVGSGVYFIHFRTPNARETGRVLRLR